MNIVYVNGYNGEKSKKPKLINKLINRDIQHARYIYNKTPFKEIESQCKDADIIIGSSNGAYIGRIIAEKYNIPLVSLNPVINIEETFRKLEIKAPIFPKIQDLLLEEIIFLNKDDSLIDYKKTYDKYTTQCVIFNNGEHRFENINEIKEYLLNFINKISLWCD